MSGRSMAENARSSRDKEAWMRLANEWQSKLDAVERRASNLKTARQS